MVMTKRRYRVIAGALALMALLIFCGTPFQQAAKAVAIVDDAIIAIVIAALAAMGISFTMTGGYQTVKGWIRDKLEESGIDFSGVKYGASSIGSLLLNNLFVRRISAFATYIQAELGLLGNDSVQIISPESTLGDITVYSLPLMVDYNEGQLLTITYKADVAPVYCAFYKNDGSNMLNPVVFSSVEFYVTEYYGKANGTESTRGPFASRYYEEYTFHYVFTGLQGASYLYNDYTYSTSDVLFNALASDGSVSGSGVTLNAVAGTIDIPGQAELDGNGGVLTLPVPWGQTITGTLTDIPTLVLEDELAGNTTLTLEPEGAVEDKVSDTATAEQPYVSSSASDYQSPGLSSVFPFCIPFDLYEFFECLAADPEAPEISWRFYVPGICDEQIEIDLSQFDTVAQIVRTMELLAFIVGLALVTREKFLRG